MLEAEACWEALCNEKSAIGPCPDGFKGVPSGFLAPQFSKDDVK